MSVKSLETLETWKKAKEFALRVYRQVLPLLPSEEKWNLNRQLRRSANSVPASIAEGYGRFYYQDNIRFCYNARGSLEETLSQPAMCHELKYVPKPLLIPWNKMAKIDTVNQWLYWILKAKQTWSDRAWSKPFGS